LSCPGRANAWTGGRQKSGTTGGKGARPGGGKKRGRVGRCASPNHPALLCPGRTKAGDRKAEAPGDGTRPGGWYRQTGRRNAVGKDAFDACARSAGKRRQRLGDAPPWPFLLCLFSLCKSLRIFLVGKLTSPNARPGGRRGVCGRKERQAGGAAAAAAPSSAFFKPSVCSWARPRRPPGPGGGPAGQER
jgi:hypothetical protein